jgi:hypothetical protein
MNGRKLFEKCPDKMEELITRVKIVLIHRNLSAISRGMLLYIIDLHNNHYAGLSKKMQEFYISEMGASSFQYIQRPDTNSINNTKLKNNANCKQ